MREIKFRAWFKPKGIMEYLMPMAPCTSEGNHICFGCEERAHRFYDCLDPNDWEVMQFTGFKDFLGDDIYDGDILQWDFTEDGKRKKDLSEVYWDDDAGMWVMDGGDDLAGYLKIQSWTIRGNRFENQELLKS